MKKGKELVVCWFNIPGTCPLPDEFVLYCQHLYALVKRNEVKSPIMRILHVLLAYSHIIMVIPFPLVYYKHTKHYLISGLFHSAKLRYLEDYKNPTPILR